MNIAMRASLMRRNQPIAVRSQPQSNVLLAAQNQKIQQINQSRLLNQQAQAQTRSRQLQDQKTRDQQTIDRNRNQRIREQQMRMQKIQEQQRIRDQQARDKAKAQEKEKQMHLSMTLRARALSHKSQPRMTKAPSNNYQKQSSANGTAKNIRNDKSVVKVSSA
ncbi:MAG: hypothetical protein ACHQUC_09350, partial [Chlamydiales bacterium]